MSNLRQRLIDKSLQRYLEKNPGSAVDITTWVPETTDLADELEYQTQRINDINAALAALDTRQPSWLKRFIKAFVNGFKTGFYNG